MYEPTMNESEQRIKQLQVLKDIARKVIDFILDPMWASIRPDLHEHIDGLRSIIQRPSAPATNGPPEAVRDA